MANKGKNFAITMFAVLGSVGMIAFLSLLFFPGLLGTQTLGGSGGGVTTTVSTASSVASAVKEGTDATLQISAYDLVSTTPTTRVASTLYAYDVDNKELLKNGASLSASASTNVDTTVGTDFVIGAFDSTYYGTLKSVTVTKTAQPVVLDNFKITTSLNVKTYDDGSALNTSNIMAISSNAEQSWDKIFLEENESNRAFNLKGFGLDLPTATNITDWTVNGKDSPIVESASMPQRLRTTLDFYFVLPESRMLKSWDTYNTGNVLFKSGGNDPVTETATLYIIDESNFASSVDKTLKSGVENDASSPADVGASDITRTVTIQ